MPKKPRRLTLSLPTRTTANNVITINRIITIIVTDTITICKALPVIVILGMVSDARRRVIKSRNAGKLREYEYRRKRYATDSKKGEYVFSGLVKGTVKDLVSSHQLKQIYQKFLPSIKWLLFKASDDIDRHGELKQLAMIAIWSALCNHEKGTEIPPGHMYTSIKRAIRQACMEDTDNYNIRPSRTSYRKYQKGIKSYREKYGREPTNHELADHMGIDILYVQRFFFRQSYKAVTVEKSESATSSFGFRNYRKGAWYWDRKNDYENRLIYWIDRHWVLGVLSHLGEASTTAMKIKALGISVAKWQKKHGFSNTYCYLQQYKTVEWARLLEQYKYRPSDGDPKKFLQSKGYRVSKIWQTVLGGKSQQRANRYY